MGAVEGSYSVVGGPQLVPGYTETRYINQAGTGCCAGYASGGGILVPGQGPAMSGITDGSSNTILASEATEPLTIQNGVKVFWSPGDNHGGWIGLPTRYNETTTQGRGHGQRTERIQV
jgi:hypothetical protein